MIFRAPPIAYHKSSFAVATLIPTAIQDQAALPLHKNMAVVAPVAVSAILVVVALLSVYICLKRNNSDCGSADGNGTHPRKMYLEDAVIMSEFGQKQATPKEAMARSSYYASPAKKPVPVGAKHEDGRVSHSVLPHDKYGDKYGSNSSQSGDSLAGDRCGSTGSLQRPHLRHFEFVS